VGADEINQLLWGAPGKISNVTFSLDTPPHNVAILVGAEGLSGDPFRSWHNVSPDPVSAHSAAPSPVHVCRPGGSCRGRRLQPVGITLTKEISLLNFYRMKSLSGWREVKQSEL
jgi:hypothetical protein